MDRVAMMNPSMRISTLYTTPGPHGLKIVGKGLFGTCHIGLSLTLLVSLVLPWPTWLPNLCSRRVQDQSGFLPFFTRAEVVYAFSAASQQSAGLQIISVSLLSPLPIIAVSCCITHQSLTCDQMIEKQDCGDVHRGFGMFQA